MSQRRSNDDRSMTPLLPYSGELEGRCQRFECRCIRLRQYEPVQLFLPLGQVGRFSVVEILLIRLLEDFDVFWAEGHPRMV